MKAGLQMFRMYLEYAKKSFRNSVVYRLETLTRILNTVVSIFVYTAIWTSIFSLNGSIDGVELKMVATHFVISLGLSAVFTNMTGEIPWKIISGDIANDLLRPISFNALVLSKTIGSVACGVLMQFIPAFAVSFFAVGILLPYSLADGLLFVVSIISGFFVYYFIDLIVSVAAFWFHQVFFLEQIKNAVIAVLSGALLPVWFLPGFLADIIRFSPFESIYFIPVSIYLGKLSGGEITAGLLRQVFWIAVLGIISRLVWKAGIRKLVIQGG